MNTCKYCLSVQWSIN